MDRQVEQALLAIKRELAVNSASAHVGVMSRDYETLKAAAEGRGYARLPTGRRDLQRVPPDRRRWPTRSELERLIEEVEAKEAPFDAGLGGEAPS